MKNENYILIQGWMINRLKLKGNQLLIFAIIYGFSQDNETKFTGSLSYLMKSINSSKNTVIKALKELEDQSLINKVQTSKNNLIFNEFSHNEPVVHKMNNPGSIIEQQGSSENEPVSSSENEPNNTILKPIEKDSNKTLFSEKPIQKISIDILNYLNDKKPSKIKFKPTTANLNDIEKRIKEGFKMEDFEKVINSKVNEWKSDDKMKKYIRPETLFGTKFNGYLVESENTNSSNDGSTNFKFNPQPKAQLL